MCLVLDIVVNHVRSIHSSADVAKVSPINETFFYHTLNATPGESFTSYAQHPASPFPTGGCQLGELSCPGYNATFVEQGWFADLGDLRQGLPAVSSQLLAWARHIVRTYDVDGLRLDTAPYVSRDFLRELQGAAGVDILGEVTALNLTFHASYQRKLRGLLNFPLAHQLPLAFCGRDGHGTAPDGTAPDDTAPDGTAPDGTAPDGTAPDGTAPDGTAPDGTAPVGAADVTPDLRLLADVAWRQAARGADAPYPGLDLLGNFADNHDGPRIGRVCLGDWERVAHALTFVMLARGVPIVYYGTKQGFMQHDQRSSLWQTGFERGGRLYGLLATINAVRRARPALAQSVAAVLHANRSSLVLSRGERRGGLVMIFLNNLDEHAAGPRTYCLAPPSRLPPLPPPGSEWVEALTA